MSVYLLATLDTKGTEAAFVRDRLLTLGIEVTVVDTGCLGTPSIQADVTRQEVFRASGTSLDAMVRLNDRGQAISQSAKGTTKVITAALNDGHLQGILALGGSAGTTIGTSSMRAVPIGIPKLMVSTLASGQVRPYVGDKDILMLNSVVDIAGINRISGEVLSEAAAAMAGLVRFRASGRKEDKPTIAATMFGVTTACVERARAILEQAGYEVLVFHATGNGGQAMESLIDEGLISGVLDLTTTELADELVGGILTAGPDRLTAASRRGVAQVVSVGAIDMVNFGPPASVPQRWQNRRFHYHNPTVTLMRTTPQENAQLGAVIATKVAQSSGPAAIMLPLRGVSAIDRKGEPFDDPEARDELFQAIRRHHGNAELIELDYHINDPEFAEAAAGKLMALIEAQRRSAH